VTMFSDDVLVYSCWISELTEVLKILHDKLYALVEIRSQFRKGRFLSLHSLNIVARHKFAKSIYLTRHICFRGAANFFLVLRLSVHFRHPFSGVNYVVMKFLKWYRRRS
jgi:hypothetical protein